MHNWYLRNDGCCRINGRNTENKYQTEKDQKIPLTKKSREKRNVKRPKQTGEKAITLKSSYQT